MPPLKIAVAMGFVLGWPGLAAAQSWAPADAARDAFLREAEEAKQVAQSGGLADATRSAVPAANRGYPTPSLGPADNLPSLDRAASRLSDVVAGQGQAPANPIRRPAAGIPSPTASPTSSPSPSPISSSVPSTPRSGGRLPISPSHHVRLGEPGSRPGGPTSLLTIGSSLAVVLGLFLLVAWAVKRAMPGRSGLLPSEVVEVLGRASLGARQQVHLVRCGSKLLLVSATPGGMETLTEIAEPDEVQRLAALCRQTQPGSTTTAFRQVFQQLAAGADHDA